MVGWAARPDAATLRRLYVDEALTVAGDGEAVGVAAQTVHHWLVAAGVPRRPSPATIRADVGDAQIVRLYTRGHTPAAIADRLGCSTSLVYFRLERRGIARRPTLPAVVSARPPPSSPTSTWTEA